MWFLDMVIVFFLHGAGLFMFDAFGILYIREANKCA